MNGGPEGEKAEGGGQTVEMRAGEMSDLISRAKEIIEGMKASTLKRDKARMRQLLEPGRRYGVPRNGDCAGMGE